MISDSGDVPRKARATQPKRTTRARTKPAAAAIEVIVVQHVLRLYVAGCTARTTQAVANLKAICEEYLNGQYELDVVDIYQQPALARRDQVIAVPTLIRQLPKPLRRIVGDMSRRERVLVGLDLVPGLPLV